MIVFVEWDSLEKKTRLTFARMRQRYMESSILFPTAASYVILKAYKKGMKVMSLPFFPPSILRYAFVNANFT